ncbi:MAG: hypothetical protein Q4Q58_07265 [Thermoplasmata archaeon]|nr:hypothetical protein [Thermoplasmata archaeon]
MLNADIPDQSIPVTTVCYTVGSSRVTAYTSASRMGVVFRIPRDAVEQCRSIVQGLGRKGGDEVWRALAAPGVYILGGVLGTVAVGSSENVLVDVSGSSRGDWTEALVMVSLQPIDSGMCAVIAKRIAASSVCSVELIVREPEEPADSFDLKKRLMVDNLEADLMQILDVADIRSIQ